MLSEENSQKVKDSLNSLLQVLTLVLMVSLILIGVYAFKGIKEIQYADDNLKQRDTISVSGEAEGYYSPDMAQTTFSVVSEADTVAEVMDSNTNKMNRVISVLKEEGVSEDDLKTTAFNLRPRYEYHDDENSGSRRVLVGYELTQSLIVKIRDLEKVGSLISEATTAGVNDVSSLSFLIEDDEKIKKELREKAIADAKEKAAVLEEQVGFSLGKIINFSQSSSSPIPRPLFEADYQQGIGGKGAGVEVEEGTNKMEANVTLTFKLK